MMNELPEGAITFLFTDIEGSTPLWERDPYAMKQSLQTHNDILHKAIREHDGRVFKIIGDAFQAAFVLPGQALEAAIAAQHGLTQNEWGETGPIKVRMGIHTAPGEVRGQDYTTTHDLNRVARIMSAGHGGQILLSQATSELVRRNLAQDIHLKDMGEHKLKGMARLEHLYQVVAPGLPQEFPPLASECIVRHNLPTQLTRFIGREQEITEVNQLLEDHRMVTLLGAGGSGKTRLAIEAAGRRISLYQNGVLFAGLADLAEPDLVLHAVALVLGLKESTDVDLIDTIKNSIQSQEMLLLLDNCEHLLAASADLSNQLLRTCPNLQILATSRQALGVAGEAVYPVPGLAVPAQADPITLEGSEAVKLFLDRTRLVQPHYQPSTDSLVAIGEICRRLDGVPLALELAAARMNILSPEQILSRLGDQFSLLKKVVRGVPERHQTLQAVVEWSYNLLSSNEKVVFNRLAVFRGGCTFEAAEVIGAGDEIAGEDILDILASLADKSMIFPEQSQNGGVRYRLLETLRQFGLDRLRETGGLDSLRKHHATYYLELVETAAQELRNRGRAALFEELEADHDNLRTAFDWALIDEDGVELGLRLAGAMRRFWETRGYLREGRDRTEAALRRSGSEGFPIARADALAGIAWLAYRQSDYLACRRYAGESLALYQSLDHKPGIARALVILGNVATEEGDYPTGSELLEEALAIRRELNDMPGIAHALMNLGWAAMRPGDNQTATRYLSEALAIHRQADNRHQIAMVLSGLGEAALRDGRYDKAVELLEESLERRVELGDKWGIGVSHGSLGWAAMAQGDLARASEHIRKSLKVRSEIGDKGGTAWCLEKLAEMALLSGKDEHAIRLFAAAAALRASIHSIIDPVDQPEYNRKVDLIRQRTGEDEFNNQWAEGGNLSLEEAVNFALNEVGQFSTAK